MIPKSFVAACALFALPGQAIAAQAAATPCLTSGEVRALATFAMPSVLTGVIDNCSRQLGANAFMTSQGRGLVAAYAAGKDAAWPQARKAFFRLAQSGKGGEKDTMGAMASMPDSALQPFVEGMIGGLIGAKLKPAQCGTADRLMRLLAPLPPQNTAELLSTILELADADGKAKPGGLAICKS
jgi:hypothetical protein